MWTLARGPDYPDENNWVGDVLWCEADNRPRRACTRLDELIVEARLEQNPDARTDLYRRIEGGFFGPEGEMPIFPVYVQLQYLAIHSWMNQIPALVGGQQWYNWTIDWEAKQAAQQ